MNDRGELPERGPQPLGHLIPGNGPDKRPTHEQAAREHARRQGRGAETGGSEGRRAQDLANSPRDKFGTVLSMNSQISQQLNRRKPLISMVFSNRQYIRDVT
jgi:hypothetical protein